MNAESSPRTPESNDEAGTVTGDSPAKQRHEYLSNRVLGVCFLCLSAILLGLLLYLTIYVVTPMTKPTPFFDKLTDAYSSHLIPKDDQQERPKIDELTVNLVVMLEYASTDIRTTGVQIAFALLGGFFLIVVGVILFAAGATGAFRFSGRAPGTQLDLASAAPGLLSVVLGAVIIMIGVSKNTERKLDSFVKRPIGIQTNPIAPPSGTTSEAVPQDLIDNEYLALPNSQDEDATPEASDP